MPAKAIVIDLLKEHDPDLNTTRATGVLVLSGIVPNNYKGALQEFSLLRNAIELANFQDAQIMTIFIENDAFAFGIVLAFIEVFKIKVRVIVKVGDQQIDLVDFVDRPNWSA